jgi:DNA-binding NarL/FixJ family response regulator
VKQTTLLLATPNTGLFYRIDLQLCGELHVLLLPQARTETEALGLLRSRHPDVALLDFDAFDENALVLIDKIAATRSTTRSLLFSKAWTEHSVLHALARGSSGCVQIDASRSELLGAVGAVLRGEIWVSRRTLATAFRQMLTIPPCDAASTFSHRLSAREREIVDWMRRGMSNKEIARKLGISHMTVKTHAHSIYHKLEIPGRMRLLGMPAAIPTSRTAAGERPSQRSEPLYRRPVMLPIARPDVRSSARTPFRTRDHCDPLA